MKIAVLLFLIVSSLWLVAAGCDKDDNPPATTDEGSGEAAQGENAPPPVPDRLEFFGYWIGMPWDEFMDRAKKVHGFTLKSAEGRGRVEGVEVEGRFIALDGKLASFHVFHTTTEPVPMKEMAFYRSLMQSVGRAEGGCQQTEGDDMICVWEVDSARLTYDKTEGWPKGAPAMEHEYSVLAIRTEPNIEELPRRESETAQKKREEAIKAAIVKAERIQLGTKAKLKPSANNCLWGLNNEDPQKALEVAECMNRSEVFNDLRTCIEPCRPPDPSLAK